MSKSRSGLRKTAAFVLCAAIASGMYILPPCTAEIDAAFTTEAANTVSAPVSSLESGFYKLDGSNNDGVTIELTCDTKGAEIYYNMTNESDAYTHYEKYTSPIVLKRNTRITAYAKKGDTESSSARFKYEFAPCAYVSAASGTYDKPFTLKLEDTLAGADYYYSLDGKKPTVHSAKYTSKGIKITKSCRLYILAVKDGMSRRIYKNDYIIKNTSNGAANKSTSSEISPNGAVMTMDGEVMSSVNAEPSRHISNNKKKTDILRLLLNNFNGNYYILMDLPVSYINSGSSLNVTDFRNGIYMNSGEVISVGGIQGKYDNNVTVASKKDATISKADVTVLSYSNGVVTLSYDIAAGTHTFTGTASVYADGSGSCTTYSKPDYSGNNSSSGGSSGSSSIDWSNDKTGRSSGGVTVNCVKCHGEGKIDCSLCEDGWRKTKVDETANLTGKKGGAKNIETKSICFTCKGTGKVDCPRCHGDGTEN